MTLLLRGRTHGFHVIQWLRLLLERIQMVVNFQNFDEYYKHHFTRQVLYSHLIPGPVFFFPLISLVSLALSLSNKAFTEKNNLKNKMACHALLLNFAVFLLFFQTKYEMLQQRKAL